MALLGSWSRRRIALAAVIAVASVGLVTTAVSVDLSVRHRLSRTRRQLSGTQKELGTTAAELSRRTAELAALSKRLDTTLANLKQVTSTLATTTGQRDQLQLTLTQTVLQLKVAQGTITAGQLTISSQGSRITDLGSCLTGVQQALNAISVGDRAVALTHLQSVSAACATAGANAIGAAYPYDFPDPFILRAGAAYYGYATNAAGGNIQVIRSADLTRWTPMPDALAQLGAWAVPGFTWAPSVVFNGGAYVLFYTAIALASGRHCLGEALASSPAGPFSDFHPAPLACGGSGEIDPAVYVNGGQSWLLWKSEAGPGPPTIWSQPLTANDLALTGAPSALLQPTQAWENGIVEAPSMLRIGTELLLFYSAANWNTSAYGIGYAVCSSPSGPCQRPLNHPLLATFLAIAGPGGADFFVDAAGRPEIAFHAWMSAAVGYPNSRLLFVRHVLLVGGVPAFTA